MQAGVQAGLEGLGQNNPLGEVNFERDRNKVVVRILDAQAGSKQTWWDWEMTMKIPCLQR